MTQYRPVAARRPLHRLALGGLDAALSALVFTLAYLIAFDVSADPGFAVYAKQILPLLPIVVAIRLLCLRFSGLYAGVARHGSATEAMSLARAVALGSLILAGVGFALRFAPEWAPLPRDKFGVPLRLPWRIVVIDAAFALILLGALRLGRRVVLRRMAMMAGRQRVIVAGDANLAHGAVHQLINDPSPDAWVPVALLEFNPGPLTTLGDLHGVPVWSGPVDHLGKLLESTGAVHVLLASETPGVMRQAVRAVGNARARFHVLPDVDDLMRLPLARPRDLRLEDLLRRMPVRPNLSAEAWGVDGKTVCITGAGGSIGSELARRMQTLGAKTLVLVGRGENSLFELQQSLMAQREAIGDTQSLPILKYVVADASNEQMMRRLLELERPDVLFHAAAHKHVPLMEAHPAQALANNSLGTARLARTARELGVQRFILISTDKAVEPTSVMGASKRLAERAVWREAALAAPGQAFGAVRFGNVLGSRGSVVTVLRRQIEAGGPVRLTDARMTRYFMTAEEAATLVILAGAQGENDRLHLLDMGEPIQIWEMARDLIRLCGYSPEDIPIVFIGARPGEKIVEDLLTKNEVVEPTSHERLLRARHEPIETDDVTRMLTELESLLHTGDAAELRAFIKREIPDYSAFNGKV